MKTKNVISLRVFLGIACAYELGDAEGAKRLFCLAVKKGWIGSGDIPTRSWKVALAGVWLIKRLALHPVPVSDILQEVKKTGHTRRNILRAAWLMHVVRSKRVGCGVWVWHLTSAKSWRLYKEIGLNMLFLPKVNKVTKALKAPKSLN